jgi:hypothetical protein
MPISLTYSGFYYLTPNGTGGYQTFGTGHPNAGYVANPTSTLTDSEDFGDDGLVAVGADVYFVPFTSTVELAGFDSSGNPVIDYGGFFYLVTNDSGLGDSFDIGFTTTGGPLALCFHTGTRIATPEGEALVEDLRIGDLLERVDGKAVPVKWIGRQTVFSAFGPAERLMPVRISAGALGNGLPHTDLTVTADHGMLVDGVICHAGALVNGTTITRVPLEEMGETYTVYHIETEEHEIILANGAPAETFIDNVSRRVFDNYAEFETLYGDVPEMEELPYPRAMSARQVPAHIANRLTTRQVA